MASYTEISTETAHAILALYGIRDLVELTPQRTGISNSNYRIRLKSGDELILKISNDKAYLELNEEQKILHYLKTLGYPYSLAAYQTLEQELVYQYEQLSGVLYPYVRGEVPVISEGNLFEIGMSLAKLHNCTADQAVPKNIRPYQSVGFDFSAIEKFVTNPKCPEYFKLAYRKIFTEENIQKIHQAKLKKGLIHGDLYFDNTLFRDGELICVLDFEQAGVGEYLFDIGVSISGSCLKQGKLDEALVSAYLKGYESERQLDKSERELIDLYIIIGLFSIARWRIRRFVEKNIDPSKKENYKELLERALNYYEHQ